MANQNNVSSFLGLAIFSVVRLHCATQLHRRREEQLKLRGTWVREQWRPFVRLVLLL